MKKQLICLLILLLGVVLHAEALVWGKNNNFKGWDQAIRAKKQIVNGVLVLTSIKFDCRIVNNQLDIDPQKYDTFTFTYRTAGGNKKKGELFYCHAGEKFSDARRWDTPSLIGDGQWHTITVSCPDKRAWTKGGNIRALRFDPTNSAGGKIEIKEMRLEKKQPEALKKKVI